MSVSDNCALIGESIHYCEQPQMEGAMKRVDHNVWPLELQLVAAQRNLHDCHHHIWCLKPNYPSVIQCTWHLSTHA